MSVLFGLSGTGWIAFRKQNQFTVHFLRRNPTVALCRMQVPYTHRFYQLPSNAVICERCLHMPGANNKVDDVPSTHP